MSSSTETADTLPESVTIPQPIFQAAVDALMSLPAGQVFEILFALRTQATPNYSTPPEPGDE